MYLVMALKEDIEVEVLGQSKTVPMPYKYVPVFDTIEEVKEFDEDGKYEVFEIDKKTKPSK